MFCLISGEGGIGKSYFTMCLEDKLTQQNIPHLCLYGKFLKSFAGVNADEIIDQASSGFVFIVDAINEIPNAGQIELLGLLGKLKKHSAIHIIITNTSHIKNK